MRVLGPRRRWIAAAGLAGVMTFLPVVPASACVIDTPLCDAKKKDHGSATGGPLDAVGPFVREVVRAIKCVDPLRAHKRCEQAADDPGPVEPDTPADSTPSPRQTPTVRPQPAAVPVNVVRRPAAPSAPAVVPPPSPVETREVRVLRVPVFTTTEEIAAAASAGIGLATAVALFGLWWLPARRRRQRRVAADYQKLTTSFVSNLSHELFTPLTPVKGYASMLQHSELPPTQVQHYAGEMAGASDRLQRVLTTIVAFAEVNAGAEPRPDLVDTSALVHQAVARVSTTETHMIKVEIGYDVPSIRANERLLGIAIEALVDNAVKFSPDGGVVEVDVTVARDVHTRAVRIRVRDEGIGMSADELRMAREAFRQVDPSYTRRFGGLGLGLALADQVARLHHGRLDMSSRPGRGSIFCLSIPMSPNEHRAADEDLAAATA